ncbi:MAG: hypothetical protein HYZ53_24760 [Planctomycetes bacterium]|nr:hypothetical protein [Planctomycetota bacterium]
MSPPGPIERLKRWLSPCPRARGPVVRSGYAEAWSAKVDAACDGLLERLTWNGEGRALVWGAGAAAFLTRLLTRRPAGGKVLVPGPLLPAAGEERKRLVGLPGGDRLVFVDGAAPQVLAALPAGSLGFAACCWGLAGEVALAPPTPAATAAAPATGSALLAVAARALRSGGALGVVDGVEGSPEVPLRALARVLRETPDLAARLARADLPRGVRSLRRMLARAGLAEVRAWEESLALSFAAGEEAFDTLVLLSGDRALFGGFVPDAFARLRAACVRELETRGRRDGEILVTHELVGCVARRP